MKKIVSLVVLLCMFTVTVAVAETKAFLENGVLVVKEVETKETEIMRVPGVPDGITAGQALELVDGKKTEIPADLRNIKAERDVFSWPGFFFFTSAQEYSRVAVYDPGKQAITTINKKGKIGEESLLWYVVLLIVAMAIVTSNIIFTHLWEWGAANVTATAFTALAVIIATTASVPAALVACVAFFSVSYATFYDFKNEKKAHRFALVIFYFSAAIATVV